MLDIAPGKPAVPRGGPHRVRRALGTALAIGRLLLSFCVTLAGAVLVAQALLWAAPGDPVDLVPNGEEMRAQLEQEWGLDRPRMLQYTGFLWNAARGDLGHSLTFRPGAPVLDLVLPAAGSSLSLLLPAVVLALGTGLGLAWFTAGRRSVVRKVVQAASVPPVFLLAFGAVEVLNRTTFDLMERGLVERPGWFALPDTDSLLKGVLAVLVMALGSGSLHEVLAACEDEIVRVRNAPFVDAAIARGAPLWRHVLPNLVAPLTSVASSRTAFFVGGLIIVEKVLHINGAGAMLWQACRLRDYPLALGITVLAASAVCAARLLADLVRLTADPRLREGDA